MKTAYDVIIKPVISERSMDDAQARKYTFKVATDANKTEIKHALEEIFDIDIERVNVMNVRGKKKRQGRTMGMTSASKKAIVTLKPNSKEIEFFQGL
jgi:Ribosomal protein L23